MAVFRRLAAEKIAGKMIQDDRGKRGYPKKCQCCTTTLSPIHSVQR